MTERDERDLRLARRQKPVEGRVEDYEAGGDDGPDGGPSEDDIARFGDVTVKCPECGTELYDDVALCWKCGRAVSGGREGEGRGAPVWIALTVLILVAVLVLAFTGGIF
jgi:hypothetical protein